jgi:uncharacterized membrane protein YkvA (DUF1232 family)
MNQAKKNPDYAQYYNEEKFLGKMKKLVVKLGEEAALRALMLYYILLSGKVPVKVRVIIVAALGYLVLPSDIISDFIPVLGFTDDIAFLTFALDQASKYADDSIKRKAEEKLKSWTTSQKRKKENRTKPSKDVPKLL